METKSKLFIQGKEYSSLEEVPPELRAIYQQVQELMQDGDGDGLPDLFDGKIWKLNAGKLGKIKQAAQLLQGQGTDARAAFQAPPPSPAPFAPGPGTRSSNTALFIIGVAVIGFILLAAAIFLLRSGIFR